MSRQAQAEREKQARIILGSAEQEVAQKFLDAANIYAQNPAAAAAACDEYHLRDHQGARFDDPHAVSDGRQHEPWRCAGAGGRG